MKRLLLLIAVLALLGVKAGAVTDFSVDNMHFFVNDDARTVTFDRLNGTIDNVLEIPPYVNYQGTTYAVTCIGSEALSGNTDITAVSIPHTVTRIAVLAFNNCTNLEVIDMPWQVKHIGNRAFYNTKWLNDQPDGPVYLGKVLYTYKGEMPQNNHLILLDGTMAIADCALMDQRNLQMIYIPNSVKVIGSAFSDCENLTSVNIPMGAEIESGAFSGCKSLTSITIPEGLTTIKQRTFQNCTALTNINLPSTVKTIGKDAFAGCTSLQSITIPNSVINIYTRAFCRCPQLSDITFPTSARFVGFDAFANTAWYNNQPDGIVYAGNIAYKYKGEMTSPTPITIKDGTTTIACNAFSNLKNITVLSLPNSLKYIGQQAFNNCTGITTLTMPNNLYAIGSGAFAGCTSLTNITFPSTLRIVGDDAFSNTIWRTQQREILYAGPVAVEPIYRPLDTELTLPDGVKSLADGFNRSNSGGAIKTLSIPEGVSIIGDYAFTNNTRLVEINIPKSVKSIGFKAFAGCTALTRINAYVNPAEVTMGLNASACFDIPSYDYDTNRAGVNTMFDLGDALSTCELHVPVGMKDTFYNTPHWNRFEYDNIIDDLIVAGPNGDINGDGNINTGDVSALYAALLAGSTDSKYDLNGDGNVNTGDISALYAIILGN